MIFKFNTTILVAPLDWGLGHSTRCIPLIKHLQSLGCRIIIAVEGAQEILLKHEFPSLEFLQLSGYQIRYTFSKRFLSAKILMQLPKIYRTVQNEHEWLKKIVTEHKIDAVISDNRYGLFHSAIPCVFITHQLLIKTPFNLAEKFLQNINYHFINKFNECWVPDEQDSLNLAGVLSHPTMLPSIPVKYLGPLSRLELKQTALIKYDLLIVLSGPEPQRTFLENTLLNQLQTFEGNALLVRGLPGEVDNLPSFNNVIIINHLLSVEMESAFNESELIISRSGYTTVMDVFKLQKKAILIPTPGQTEQEYLAKHLAKQGWCLTVEQHEFNLQASLKQANFFPFKFPDLSMDGYKKIIENFLSDIQSD